ncbi:MAG: NUDIX hydrolase [Cyclobacteriaceae bacterium]|nr:NUDIX hydrolase [Cyclobacteriaceae bacterium]
MENKIIKKFGNRLRVRVSGILVEDDRILLVRHKSLGKGGILWAPPGGGMKFGFSAHQNLIREFMEETGLEISISGFLFIHEFLRTPLHAIELFFEVRKTGGSLRTGKDPEMKANEQIIEKVEFIDFKSLIRMEKMQIHQILWDCTSYEELTSKRGYLKFV